MCFQSSLRKTGHTKKVMANTHISYPAVRPKPDGSQKVEIPVGNYGVPEMMTHGLDKNEAISKPVHELELSEKQWNENKMKMDFAMLRKTEGIHAPLKLQMEFGVAKRNLRLPGLHSSGLMMDILTGRDEMIDFDDILNNPYESETIVDHHGLMEKRLNIL
ncbi:proteasome maturation protein-like [Pecten maximus]|uniref:proteasome maturation protein-like n=1 Tax=Pecten maximus TaxID=6579 RepID=UPI001458E506|nr:proteasome maturation protein-like [Pecten maximus]